MTKRTRDVVVSELKEAVAQERACTLRVLHLLREVEAKQLYLEMAYPSLFAFATGELGYSEAGAHRRIAAMRLVKAVPEMEERIEDGSLSLCVAASTQSFFRQEDLRRREDGVAPLTPEAKIKIVQSMLGASRRECESKLAAISPQSIHPPEKVRPVGDGKVTIQFVASEELLGKLERLKGLLAHQNWEGRYEKLFEILADMALRKLEPACERKGRQKESTVEVPGEKLEPAEKQEHEHAQVQTQMAPDPQARGSSFLTMVPSPFPPAEGKAGQSRYIKAPIRHEVWDRDQGRCTYRDPETGRICGSRHGLELYHVRPYAWGGNNSTANLRLRCRGHNSYAAKQLGLSGPGLKQKQSK